VAEALRAAGATVELHRDHFADDAPDVEWLAEAGRRGWVVLTKDDAIRRNPLERRALLTANVRAFILTSQNMSGPDMAGLVVRFLPTIETLARSGKQPFIALVTRSSVAIANLKGSRR
jgi:predicted nuclease of predicted toxin-antitoxin system